RLDQLVQLLDREGPGLLLAVDEKSRGRIDLELVGGPVADPFDAFEHLLIRETGLETVLGEPRLPDRGEQRLQGLFHRPGPLVMGGFASPTATWPSGPGCSRSASAAVCAAAVRPNSAMPVPASAPARARAETVRRNWRRVLSNGYPLGL